ncbi:GntR family transcriptional regulator [Oscillibacter sp. MSJ-2]|uniref:GntR family transcriptional regulator n=2 Tax=Dysosmobacter acutus TaxID=2841504 RepID=A0ABS6FAI6_9FIRM|nr:GntR family transcriptional regulator [Dysosmobacter acutus]
MENSMELRKAVYSALLTQIQFGAYRCGEKLPIIEETSERLCVSIDTARAAYLKLKEKGYISLVKNAGATVKAAYDDKETERFIQTFFSTRKDAMMDLGNSLGPLLGNAQWLGLKYASPQTLEAMERLFREEKTAAPFAMLSHLNQKYCALGNSLLMHLVWQMFMFLYDPFFCIEDNQRYFDPSADYLQTLLALCRKKDWSGLRSAVDRSIKQIPSALAWFYESRITFPPPEAETPFIWSSYKKSQQLCYTIAMDILLSISRGIYPAGSLLPSQEELARQRGVSVSTVRRALDLLSSVGAVKSAKYVGTRVLPLDKATDNSDFSKPVLRRRLLDMAESLQLLAISCKEVSLTTLSALDAGSVQRLYGQLKENRDWRRGETLSYYILDLIAKCAPHRAIRTVYSELLRQFFWGYAFRGMKGSQETINQVYDPYLDDLIQALENMDFPQFSAHLERLALYELRTTVEFLWQLNIPGAEKLLIPDVSES